MKKLLTLALTTPLFISGCTQDIVINSNGYFVGYNGTIIKTEVATRNNKVIYVNVDETLGRNYTAREYMSEVDNRYSGLFYETFPMVQVKITGGHKYCIARHINENEVERSTTEKEDPTDPNSLGKPLTGSDGAPIPRQIVDLQYIRSSDIGGCDKLGDFRTDLELMQEIDARFGDVVTWLHFTSYQESWSLEELARNRKYSNLTFPDDLERSLVSSINAGAGNTGSAEIQYKIFNSKITNARRESFKIDGVSKSFDPTWTSDKFETNMELIETYFLNKNIYDIDSSIFSKEIDGPTITGASVLGATAYARSIALIIEKIKKISN